MPPPVLAMILLANDQIIGITQATSIIGQHLDCHKRKDKMVEEAFQVACMVALAAVGLSIRCKR